MELNQKKILIRHLKLEIHKLAGILKQKMDHVINYWFTLKYYTHNFHSVYKLLHKFLNVYGNEATSCHSCYHFLTHGLISIQENTLICNPLLDYVILQISWMWALTNIAKSVNSSIYDDAIKVYLCVLKNFDALILHDDMSSEYTLNELPLFYDFV